MTVPSVLTDKAANGQVKMLNVFVDSINAKGEHRFDSQWTLDTLKDRLEVITGIGRGFMCIWVNNSPLNTNTSEQITLENLGVTSGSVITVKSLSQEGKPSQINEFNDLSQVKKFELEDAEYDKKTDTVREYMRRNKIGKYAESTEMKDADTDHYSLADLPAIGSRCEIQLDSGFSKRGTVRYCGETRFKQGLWVGVEYDEPVGKHDGTVQGFEYFKCPHKHGAMVRPNKVVIGDFPEIDPFDELDEM